MYKDYTQMGHNAGDDIYEVAPDVDNDIFTGILLAIIISLLHLMSHQK